MLELRGKEDKTEESAGKTTGDREAPEGRWQGRGNPRLWRKESCGEGPMDKEGPTQEGTESQKAR